MAKKTNAANNAANAVRKNKVAIVKPVAKVSNKIPFKLSMSEFDALKPLFIKLYSLKNNEVSPIARVDLFKSLRASVVESWKNMNECKVVDAKLTPYIYVRKELAYRIDMLIGERLAATPLQNGNAVAIKVRESNSTGISTIQLGDYYPIIPGSSKMIKSLAKTKVGDGKLFAIKERKTDGDYITVYRVKVELSTVDGKTVKTKVATKESNFIQRFSQTETAFKKGVVNGLHRAV